MAYTEPQMTDPKGNADKDVVSKVLSDYTKAWKAKQAKETLFVDIYRRYRSYLDVSQQTTRSMLFIPESFTLVETVAPRMTAQKPGFKVLPRDSGDITTADKVGQLLDYRYEVMELQPKIKDYVKQALIYGTSFMKVGWDGGEKRPDAQPIDIADIFGDPNSTDWQGGFMIHRYYRDVETLKNSAVKYKNLDQLELRVSTQKRDEQFRQDRQSIQGIPYDPDMDGIECLEWWGRVKGVVTVQVVADRSICIRDEAPNLPLDEYPFVELYDQKVPFEKWGIGEIEPIIDLQDEENTIRNQRIDEKNLSIHNMWLVGKNSGIDYKTLVSKPGGIVLAQDINQIKPLDKQNITQDSVVELNLIKQDIRNSTGVNDWVRGEQGGNTTATETAIKTQESNQRFNEKINNLEISLKKLGKWIIALDAKYLTKEVTIRITGKFGPDVETITPEDVRQEYDIDIETGSSLPSNPDLRRQQLKELVTVIAPFLVNPNGIPDGMRELLRSLIQSYDLKNADEILQGAEHPIVSQVMANLEPTDLQGVPPQMVQQEIKRRLMAQGSLTSPGTQVPPGPTPIPTQPAPPVTPAQPLAPTLGGY